MSRRQLSRQAQAFENLLESSDDDDSFTPGKSRKANKKAGSKKTKSPGSSHTPDFKLREEAARPADHKNNDDQGDAGSLFELFGGSLPNDVIIDVLQACGGSQEAAIEALLTMATTGPSSSTPDNTATSSSAAPANPSSSAGPNLWDMLPQECKLLILEHLSLKDLSKAAATAREFAEYVRSQRRSLRTISVPNGLTMHAVRGLIAAFPTATAVDFSRWSKSLRFPNNFEDIAAAVAGGGRDRLLQTPTPGAPIESLSLSKCAETTNGDVAVVCDTVKTLKALDLSKCSKIDDAVLLTIARYRREYVDLEESTDAMGDEMAVTSLAAQLKSSAYIVETPAAAVRRIVAEEEQARKQRAASASAAAARGFEELNLAGTLVTGRGVADLLRGGSARAPSLMTLDVSRCVKVTGDALVPGPQSLLRVLRASGCSAVRSITFQLPSTSNLQELVLTDCKSLMELVILSAPDLQTLNVSGCSQLSVLSLHCPSLLTLKASGCTKLALGAGIAVGGFSEHNMVFDCPNLQSANFFGCRNLDIVSLEAALPSFISLQELDLSGCVSLSRVVAVQGEGLPCLKRLIIDGCGVIRQVSITAPALEKLSAQACVRLMEVRMVQSVPKVIDFENCAELREVAVGGGGGSIGGEGNDNGGMSQAERTGGAGGRSEKSKGPRRVLVLRGCEKLPMEARERLKACVQS